MSPPELVAPRPGASLAWAGEIPNDHADAADLLDVTVPSIPVVRRGNRTIWDAASAPSRDSVAESDARKAAPQWGSYRPVTLELLREVLAGLRRI